MIIKKFSLFVEARLSDVANLKFSTDSSISKVVKSNLDKKVDFSARLKKFITTKKNKIRLVYNDNAVHSIKKRIEDRTSFRSIKEFNERISYLLNILFPDRLDDFHSDGKYSLYDREHNFTILLGFNRNLFESKNILSIITILPGKTSNNSIEIFEIE
jgi:hypothetical protein